MIHIKVVHLFDVTKPARYYSSEAGCQTIIDEQSRSCIGIDTNIFTVSYLEESKTISVYLTKEKGNFNLRGLTMFALRQRKTVLNEPGARLLIRWLMTGERKKDKNEKQANRRPFSGP